MTAPGWYRITLYGRTFGGVEVMLLDTWTRVPQSKAVPVTVGGQDRAPEPVGRLEATFYSPEDAQRYAEETHAQALLEQMLFEDQRIADEMPRDPFGEQQDPGEGGPDGR